MMTFEDVKSLFSWAFGLGGWGVAIFLVVYFMFWPEQAEKFTALIFKVLSCFWKGAEKKYIAHDIQGRVNNFVNNYLGKEIKDFKAPNIKISWAESDLDRTSFLENGELIVRMRKSSCQNENFVSASMVYISEALLTKTKRYISPRQKKSLDLFVANKLFQSEKRDVLIKFIDEFLQAGTDDSGIREYFNKFHIMDTAGVFFPVFVQEMSFLGEKVFGGGRDPKIFQEVNELIEFLENYSNREVGQITKLEFEGEYSKFGIVIVGKQWKIDYQGITPYEAFIKGAYGKEFETLYVIGPAVRQVNIDQLCGESLLNDIGFSIFNRKKYKAKIKKENSGIEVDSYLVVLRKNSIDHYHPPEPK